MNGFNKMKIMKYALLCSLTSLVMAICMNSISQHHVFAADTYKVSTIAGIYNTIGSADGDQHTATFYIPTGIAIDAHGKLYITDPGNHQIRMIESSGFETKVTTIAGHTRVAGYTNGLGTDAHFEQPYGITIDPKTANLYVTDSANRLIRKLVKLPDHAWNVSTFAGSYRIRGDHDGNDLNASFDIALGMTSDNLGNLYVADIGQSKSPQEGNIKLRKIDATGKVTTIAQSIASGDIAKHSAYDFNGITIDHSTGILYSADFRSHVIRMIKPDGSVSTFAGSAGVSGFKDGQGTAARFNKPQGITMDSQGNLFVVDTGNNVIRKIDKEGNVTTIAGNAQTSGFADGVGSSARFDKPRGIAIDKLGNLYVTDSINRVIRKLSPPASSQIPIPSVPTSDGTNAGDSGGTNIGSCRSFPIAFKPDTVRISINQEEINNIHTESMNTTVTEAMLDSSVVLAKLNQRSTDKPITLRASLDQAADALTLKLDAALLQTLRERNVTMEVNNGKQIYQVRLKQLNLESVAQQVGLSTAWKDVIVQFKVNKSTTCNTDLFTNQIQTKDATIIVNPFHVQVDYVYQGRTAIPIELASPATYVTKLIPTSLSASQVTTAVTLDRNGVITHSPTTRKVIDGQSYIVIQDMNLSGDYAVIQNTKSFTDVATHWAKTSVNEGGSRLIINGVSDSNFAPNRSVTRSEFASLLVRGLGLTTGASSTSNITSSSMNSSTSSSMSSKNSSMITFTDVASSAWYADSVQSATAYNLITGYADKSFKPNQLITREEAMVILGRAMRLIGYDTQVASKAISLDTYQDTKQLSSWAVDDATLNLKAKTIQGDENQYLRPQAPITRAETATVILRLLEQASHINTR